MWTVRQARSAVKGFVRAPNRPRTAFRALAAGLQRSPAGMTRTIVVTGASSGLGRAIVRAFARRGDRLALLARQSARLEAAREEALALGASGAIAIPVDVADAQAVDEAADTVVRRFGPIDVWVNNAMVSVFSPVSRLTADEIRRVTDVTYLGTVHGTLAALRHMRPRDAGTIVQVGSALAYRGIPLQSAYCAAKHAVQGFCDSLRAELLHDGSRVHVTMVQMPALNTPQFDWSRSHMPRQVQPVPPIYDPDVGARAVVFTSESRRREMWVGWPSVMAILSARVAPGLGDRYLGRTGYDSQMTSEETTAGGPDNLWEPSALDRAAHGRFGDRAHRQSWQLWANMHRGLIGSLAGLVVGGLLAVTARRLSHS